MSKFAGGVYCALWLMVIFGGGNVSIEQTLNITGSKSESNRVLVLSHLMGGLPLENVSNSKDTELLLSSLLSESHVIDVGMAGTAMRFLTSFFSIQEGRDVVITGCERMKQRPIGILVNALKDLGANIEYVADKGYPPLKIRGKRITGGLVRLSAKISSQYVTSLMLIAPFLEKGLCMELEGKITSLPYIQMTLRILTQLGFEACFDKNTITIPPQKSVGKARFKIESDWSSASYYYSLLALSGGNYIKLNTYKKDSLQGDSEVARIYKMFGVNTNFEGNTLVLSKIRDFKKANFVELDLVDTPDITQTIAVTCAGLKIKAKLTGLHTLKIKETDRIEALRKELEKLGVDVVTTENSLELREFKDVDKIAPIEVYNDHRMAMAFATMGVMYPLCIKDERVVNKSYPEFWDHLRSILDLKIC